MKTILATLFFIAAMASASVSFAEDSTEPDDTGQADTQEYIQETDQPSVQESGQVSGEGSDLYMNEIKTNCEAEASGMPEEDARAYIRECIDNMKQSFSGQ